MHVGFRHGIRLATQREQRAPFPRRRVHRARVFAILADAVVSGFCLRISSRGEEVVADGFRHTPFTSECGATYIRLYDLERERNVWMMAPVLATALPRGAISSRR